MLAAQRDAVAPPGREVEHQLKRQPRLRANRMACPELLDLLIGPCVVALRFLDLHPNAVARILLHQVHALARGGAPLPEGGSFLNHGPCRSALVRTSGNDVSLPLKSYAQLPFIAELRAELAIVKYELHRLRAIDRAAGTLSNPNATLNSSSVYSLKRADRGFAFGGKPENICSFRAFPVLTTTRIPGHPAQSDRLWLWLRCRAARQAHREHRAFARLARHGHVASHHARELAGDGKPEPRTAEALSGRGIGLTEVLEQLSLLVRSHADSCVGDRELDPVATVSDPARLQPDLALFGELAGIAQQVEQYLPQPHGVHGQCAEVLLGVNHEVVLVLL